MSTQIVLVHGLIGNLSDGELLRAFDGRALAPDLLGYGAHADAVADELSLQGQARFLADWLQRNVAAPAHFVGHSVGAAVAVLVADAHPELCASFTSVEGNFTLKDAFWSAQMATRPLDAVEAVFEGYKSDVAGWLAGAGVAADERTLAIGRAWLENQPVSTIWAQAKAVVSTTSDPAYLATVRRLLDSECGFHLLAGARSAADWDVPGWVRNGATSSTELAERGHLMMLEAPRQFADAVVESLQR